MNKRSKRKMLIFLGSLLIILGMIIVYFNLPYSPTRAEFKQITGHLLQETTASAEVFTEEDIAGLPSPVQKYFRYCGYIGTLKMSSMHAVFKDVEFLLDKNKPVKIDYTQYNYIAKPNRVAYIDSTMYGIPFEGLDAYTDGDGSMKGVLAKQFTLFEQTGAVMDKASLVTFLSECLFVPSAALQDYVTWEAIDDLHAKATISYYGISAGGVFTFNEKGEMTSFVTDDREAVATDGTSQKVRWSAVCRDYAVAGGIRRPTVLQAIWHYEEGDLVYFDSKNVRIEFN